MSNVSLASNGGDFVQSFLSYDNLVLHTYLLFSDISGQSYTNLRHFGFERYCDYIRLGFKGLFAISLTAKMTKWCWRRLEGRWGGLTSHSLQHGEKPPRKNLSHVYVKK